MQEARVAVVRQNPKSEEACPLDCTKPAEFESRRDERSTIMEWSENIGLGPQQWYPGGTELFKQGAPAEYVYFLERGLVKISHMDPSGLEMIISINATKGSLMGASCAVLEKHFVTATVLTRTQLRHIPSAQFRSQLNRDVNMSWHIHQMHCRMLSALIVQRAQMASLSVRQRLEQLLWRLITTMELKRENGEVRLPLPLKYWEIAQLVMVTPEHLSRVVSALEREGLLIKEKSGTLVFPDPDKLWHGAT